MGLPPRDGERHTYADYLAWPEDARYELIDGIAYAMAPAPAEIYELQGLRASKVLPRVQIDWERVLANVG